jgi:ABC-2 type transport system permease protein
LEQAEIDSNPGCPALAFSIAAMPLALRWFTLINPPRYFLVVVRSVFLKRVGIDVPWPDLLAMTLLGTGMLALSVPRFRKSLV